MKSKTKAAAAIWEIMRGGGGGSGPPWADLIAGLI